jgi:hypothetical protein
MQIQCNNTCLAASAPQGMDVGPGAEGEGRGSGGGGGGSGTQLSLSAANKWRDVPLVRVQVRRKR